MALNTHQHIICTTMKAIKIILLASVLAMLPLASKAQTACYATTVDDPNGDGYSYREVNNCPVVRGTFTNTNWRVSIGAYEPAAYLYEGTDLRTGNSIELMDMDVHGTTERPQYRFRNGDITYAVAFRYSDPSTIRLQVYQGSQEILNELLYR